jgi:hypothetical protein
MTPHESMEHLREVSKTYPLGVLVDRRALASASASAPASAVRES